MELLIKSLKQSRKEGRLAVLIYRELLLTEGNSLREEAPDVILLLDRFDEEILNLPFWEETGVDLEGYYAVIPLHHPDLIEAIKNRKKMEEVYKEIEECRKRGVYSIMEKQFPAIRRRAVSKRPLPNFHVGIQTGMEEFHIFEMSTIEMLVQALLHSKIVKGRIAS